MCTLAYVYTYVLAYVCMDRFAYVYTCAFAHTSRLEGIVLDSSNNTFVSLTENPLLMKWRNPGDSCSHLSPFSP